MEEKYLPIGTICTVKGSNKKVMITGFLSTEYSGNVKMYDYQGCIYPEGVLIKNKQISFNHGDIKKVDYMGYKNEAHDNLSGVLLGENIPIPDKAYEENPNFSNFKFDENGVVIFDGPMVEETFQNEETSYKEMLQNPFNEEFELTPRDNPGKVDNISSGFKFDENGVILEDNHGIANTPEEQPRFVFDENGVIIADNTVIKEDVMKTGEAIDNSDKSSGAAGFEFDENGVIIADNTVMKEDVMKTGETIDNSDKSSAATGFVFDENGVIIADNTAQAV